MNYAHLHYRACREMVRKVCDCSLREFFMTFVRLFGKLDCCGEFFFLMSNDRTKLCYGTEIALAMVNSISNSLKLHCSRQSTLN